MITFENKRTKTFVKKEKNPVELKDDVIRKMTVFKNDL